MADPKAFVQHLLLRFYAALVLAMPAAAGAAPLTISWKDNDLEIRGERLPGGAMKVNYLEAYCRPDCHDADWGKHTVVGHRTELVSASPDGRELRLRCTLRDGVTVEHAILAHDDEIEFRLSAHNPTGERSQAHWAQPCIRVGAFTGLGDAKNASSYEYLRKSFVFIDGELQTMPARAWSVKARYTPGQTWAAPGVPGNDVNPRPLNPRVPSNGLIGCFSADDAMVFAVAWEPYQELFQGVITCIHSDFRLGGLRPGERLEIRGRMYFVKNDIPALLERYRRDFPEQAARHAAARREEARAKRAFGGIEPRLSPDGARIALSYQGALAVMPAAGGALRVVSGGGYDVSPAWSPDGEALAGVRFASGREGRLVLVRAGAGGEIRQPAAVPPARGPLFFHPDGRRLLGGFRREGGEERIAWCDLESGEVRPVDGIAASLAGWRAVYALSSDGRWIAYAAHRDRPGEQDGNNGPQAAVWRVAAEGGEPEKLFEFPARIYRLEWAASGRGLYLVSDFGGAHNAVWRADLVDSAAPIQKLTHGEADEDWPSASACGRFLIHTDNVEGATALVRLDLESGAASALAIAGLEQGAAGALHLKAVDAAEGDPCGARVSVRGPDGRHHAPIGALHRQLGGRGYFYLSGFDRLEVPDGEYEVTAWRGIEYRPFAARVQVVAGENVPLRIALERWIDLPARGWYSGENHIHANYGYGAWYSTPASVLAQVEGEDLHVANLMVANSDGDGVFDRQFFRGGPDPMSARRRVLYWNEEFRSTIWGHMTLVNLERLVEPIFTGFAATTNPFDLPSNADIASRTRAEKGVASYTHPASNRESPYDGAYSAKGLPIDAALGHIDTVDVMGFGYDATLPLWYKLLNCGFRLPAAAGTDCFLNRIGSFPPGWGRAYVRIDGEFSYARWIEGQRAGRSFVTTGPWLTLRAAGLGPGDTLRLDAPGAVVVGIECQSQFPLDAVELVHDGAAVLGAKAEADASGRVSVARTIAVERSGWLAARAAGPAPAGYAAGRSIAHTSPIWLELQGRPQRAREEAAYFLAWIDRLEADLRRRDRVPGGIGRVEALLEAAREVYRRKARGE
jgi:hypothetical protein